MRSLRLQFCVLLVLAGLGCWSYVLLSRLSLPESSHAPEWWSPTPQPPPKTVDDLIDITFVAVKVGCSQADAEADWEQRHTPAWAWGAKHTTVLGGVLLTLGLVLGVRVVTGSRGQAAPRLQP